MKKLLLLTAVLLVALPSFLFAKGDIIAYLPEYRSAPTNEQLDKLTDIVLFSITPENHNVTLPTGGSGWTRNVSDVVSRAHQRGVRVIIALGGWGRTGTFPESVEPANRQTFVNNIMRLVNDNNFDGVDIDWEYPTSPEEVTNFEGFMVALKAALGNKRLSFAIGAQYAPNKYTQATYAAMDALHLMTYDYWRGDYAHHSDYEHTKSVLNTWINSSRISNEKIFLGVPFYGRDKDRWGEETYSTIISSNKATYSAINSAPGTINNSKSEHHGKSVDWLYDGIPTIKQKTADAYNAGAGGIMIWELGQDVAVTDQYSLLNAIWQQTQELKPVGHTITASSGAGGTILPSGQVGVNPGASQTFTFTPNSNYEIDKVLVNSSEVSPSGNSYTVQNVTGNMTIAVSFKYSGGGNPPAEFIDLFDNESIGWADESAGAGGSASANINSQNPLKATLNISGYNASENIYPYAMVTAYPQADFSGFTKVEITYSSNAPIQIGIGSTVQYEDYTVTYYATLPMSSSQTTVSLNLSEFSAPEYMWNPDWKGTLPESQKLLSSIGKDKIKGIKFYHNNDLEGETGFREQGVEITVNSVRLYGTEWNEEPCDDCNGPSSIAKNKTISRVMSAGIINGTLNLSLPTTAKNATVMLFDVRGRLLFNSQVSISAGAASVALPKNIAQNQAAILQVKTNSGVNLTKRVLIK